MEQILDEKSVEKLSALDIEGAELHRTITDAVADRSLIEERWVEDMRQYMGSYDARTLQQLEDDDRSSVFVNLTRPKTDNAEAQLVDMLFPNDDKNWGIQPTPVPELAKAAKSKNPAQIGGMEWRYSDNGEPVTEGDLAIQEMQVSVDRAKAMEKEIDDQLIESDYNNEARKAISYACKLGTGVLCGPEVERVERHSWKLVEKNGKRKPKLMVADDPLPRVRNVLPWDFFPDLSADCVENAEYVFERMYLTRKQVRDLRRRKGYIEKQIEKLLEMDAGETRTSSRNIDELREMVGLTPNHADTRYEVWVYRGPVDREVLKEAKITSEDGLDERDGMIVMSGGVILKVALNPMDSSRHPYYVYNWEEDDTCIFGYGVPYQMRDTQKIINTSWRMMLDNASKSAGPQIVLQGKKLRPQDGDYQIYPWKTWINEDPTKSINEVFGTFNFNSITDDLASIFQMAQVLVNQETNLPVIAQGEQGAVTPTVGGMSMLMNAATASRRNQVKAWDDNISKPMIRAFYDWNMEFNKKDDIKGDYEVEARGTSALLIKEMQTQHIMAMLDKYAAHPELGKWLKAGDGLKKLAQAQHIPPNEIVRTQEEVTEIEQQMAAQSQEQQDPAVVVEQLRGQAARNRDASEEKMQTEKLAFDAQQRDAERQLKIQIKQMELEKAAMEREVSIMKLAMEQEVSVEKITADLQKHRDALDLDMSKFLTESRLKQEGGDKANYGLE